MSRATAASIALAGVAALAAVTTRGSVARADDAPFSERARTVIVLDNLGGFIHSETTTNGQPGAGANVFGVYPFTPIARFGVHEFVTSGLSLGTGLIYSDNGSFQAAGGTTLGLAPRVGYAFGFTPTLAFWIRGGITYLHTSISGGGEQWQLSPGGEAFLVVTPVPHFGITLGPFGEFGVAGQQCGGQNCTGVDYRQSYYGVTFGVLADF